MTIDKMIEALEKIRDEHGGQVWVEDSSGTLIYGVEVDQDDSGNVAARMA